MTDDTIDRIFDALDEALRPMGYERFDEGIGRVAGWFSQIAEMTALMQNRGAFRDWLYHVDEPDPAELDQGLQLLPNLVYIIRQFATPVAKKMPYPPGGAPSATTPEQRKEICAEIQRLYDGGFRLGAAYKRIAKHYGISLRSVQRIWSERGKG